ncbi:DUF4226 domain-containing protein [Mycobacterium sp. Y57]|uniref:EspA/EspE family type VII secretion system effector n=1 Tax=Mycolicibacterium xanthum TaxID=2796469 RepID=UPI001C85EFB8|nr:EspA/EspE family type VII secretion system effector [Mycolicibacterium xanthum]MBX7432576.1 DUF4226 domain-containing protein [Mycolicibacterium xanthum]
MSVLDAFLATWSQARRTFGSGAPQTGEVFDNSGSLRRLQSTVQTATPAGHWTGGAATAYGGANTEHGRVIGALGGLDQRLSAHVTESAQVVATGRRNLDAIRQWVLSAAQSVPPGPNREQMLMPIVSKGLARVSEVVGASNGQLNTIGGKISLLGTEYTALGDQKFAPASDNESEDGPEGKDDGDGQGEDDKDKKKGDDERRRDIDDAAD